MDPSEQMQQAAAAWSEAQQQLWSQWQSGMRGTGAPGPIPGSELWEQAVAHWQTGVTNLLTSQQQALRDWAGQVPTADWAPEDARQWADQGIDMVSRWSAAQAQFWEHWFDALRQGMPVFPTPSGATTQEDMVKGWQEAAESVQSLQRDWLAAWTRAASTPGGKKD